MLKCSNVKKKYFNKTALENVTLELEAGRIYALLGPNGSGKTTFMKMVAGLEKPTEGTVLYKGQPIGAASKKEVSYMPTEDYFYPYMTVEDVGRYYQDFFADFNFDNYKAMVEDMGVELKEKVTRISTGMAAKVRLAAALSRKAKLYLLDEPLNGIDLVARDKIMDVLVIGEGIDFKLINASPVKTTLYCPLGRTLNLEYLFSKKMKLPICKGNFSKEDCKEMVCHKARRVLEEYGMFVVNIDRYYLDYLKCEKAHMGYHTILVKNYNENLSAFEVYDALAGSTPVVLDVDSFFSGVLSNCALSSNSEYYYWDKSQEVSDTTITELQNPASDLIIESVYRSSERMQSEVLPKVFRFLNQVDLMHTKEIADKKTLNYWNIQKTLFQNTFIEQEVKHSFYRKAFFEVVDEYYRSSNIENIRKMEEEYFTVLNIIYENYKKGDSEYIFQNIRILLNIEKNIYECIYHG